MLTNFTDFFKQSVEFNCQLTCQNQSNFKQLMKVFPNHMHGSNILSSECQSYRDHSLLIRTNSAVNYKSINRISM